jgi:hypothetical protein
VRWVAAVLLLSAPLRADDLAEVRKIAALVEPLDLPDIAGLPYVQFNRGWRGTSGFDYEWGWLLDKSEEEITVFTVDLRTRKLPLGSDEAEQWRGRMEGNPLPGAYVAREFEEPRGPLAVSLYWALKLGHEDRAVAWARARLGKRRWWMLASECRRELCVAARAKAMWEAHEGAPYRDLIDLWKRIEQIDPDDLEDLGVMLGSAPAHNWIDDYRSLMAEREPAERGTPEYWIFQLRDCTRFFIQGRFRPLVKIGDAGDTYAQLVKLGWDALPALVEANGGGRPTRGVYEVNFHGRYERRLASRAEVCAWIIEDITGETYLDGRVREWWKEASRLGREKYFEKRLRSADARGRYVAARALLPERLELVWEVATSSSGDARGALLYALKPHIDKEDAPRLRPMLKDADPSTCLMAARLLERRCGTSVGRAEVIDRIRDARIGSSQRNALDYLAQAQDETLVPTLVEFMESCETDLRRDTLASVRWFPHPRLAAVLLQALDTTTSPAGWRIAYDEAAHYRDAVAGALVEMLGYPDDWPTGASDEERSRAAKALRKWVESTNHDWGKLRRAARERIP